MGARWYDSRIGRWISPDSIVPDPANPQSLNRYSYVLGNPLKYTDPSGHAADMGGGDSEPPWWERLITWAARYYNYRSPEERAESYALFQEVEQQRLDRQAAAAQYYESVKARMYNDTGADEVTLPLIPGGEEAALLGWGIRRAIDGERGDLAYLLFGDKGGGLPIAFCGGVVDVGPQVYRHYTSAENYRKILAEKRFKPNPDNSRVYFTTPNYYSNVPAEIEGAINVVSGHGDYYIDVDLSKTNWNGWEYVYEPLPWGFPTGEYWYEGGPIDISAPGAIVGGGPTTSLIP